MNTAAALRLPFVVAPLSAENGDTVVRLNERYALSVWLHTRMAVLNLRRLLNLGLTHHAGAWALA